jgi:hypothetical protein
VEARVEADTTKFAKEVNDKIPILRKDVLILKEELDNPMIGNPAASAEDVLEYLQIRVRFYTLFLFLFTFCVSFIS